MTVELRNRIAVMLLTAIVVMGTRKAHYGAIAGWLSDWIYKIGHYRRFRSSSSSSSNRGPLHSSSPQDPTYSPFTAFGPWRRTEYAQVMSEGGQ